MKRLVLVGSGEFTPAMEVVDKYLLNLIESKTVAILPTAAGLEDTPGKWIEDGINHFLKLGGNPVGVPILNRDHDSQEYLDLLKQVSWIYFSGGNPGHLFATLKGTRIWEFVKDFYDKGGLLAGCSAGAMVMGEYVLSNAQEMVRKKELPRWKKAFGLVNYSIVPHFNWIKEKRSDTVEKIITSCPGKLVGIDEDTALIIIDGGEQVMGRGEVHQLK